MRSFLAVGVLVVVVMSAVRGESDEPGGRPESELAIVNIVSWGSSRAESGDEYHTGFLHARRIETTGTALPETFKLHFRRKLSGGPGATPWNRLPARSGGMLKLNNGEWLVAQFQKVQGKWIVACGDNFVQLTRPEDLPDDELAVLQKRFKTQLVRQWLPDEDVLEVVMRRINWRMSVGEFRKAFRDENISPDKWRLDRGSFRNTLLVHYPNTVVAFEFAGIVDTNERDEKVHVPLASCLVGFQIQHPVTDRPDTSSRRPPQSIHYQYLEQLHDAYQARLDRDDMPYEHSPNIPTGKAYGYKFGDKITSKMDGEIRFAYWSNTSPEGVFAKAPSELISADIKREREAAGIRTENWPIPVCGNDFIPILPRP